MGYSHRCLVYSLYCRYRGSFYIEIQVKVAEAGFEFSRWVSKEVLAAHSFHTGADLHFLVNLGIPKRPHAFYHWIHSGVPAFTNHKVV